MLNPVVLIKPRLNKLEVLLYESYYYVFHYSKLSFLPILKDKCMSNAGKEIKLGTNILTN